MNYTDQDTEYVRQQEKLNNANSTPNYVVPAVPRDTNTLVAMGLIGFGALILITRFFGEGIDLTPGLILFTIASCFLFFAFSQRIFGLLIPGSILTGLALGVPFADLTNGMTVLWGLALGFGMIAFLGKAMFRVNSSWAMIPAAILFMVGVIIAVSSLPGFLGLGMIWVPLLLIGVGLYLGSTNKRIF